MELLGLVDLTFMTHLDVPFDVVNQHGPPESKEQACLD